MAKDGFFASNDDPFIEYGSGRDVKDAQEELGVHEGVSTTVAKGVDNQSKGDDFVPKNS